MKVSALALVALLPSSAHAFAPPSSSRTAFSHGKVTKSSLWSSSEKEEDSSITKVAVLQENEETGESKLDVAVVSGEGAAAAIKDGKTEELLEDADGLAKALQELKDSSAISLDKDGVEAIDEDIQQLLVDVETEAEKAAQDLIDDECEVDEQGQAADELCLDDEKKQGLRSYLKRTIGKSMKNLRGLPEEEDEEPSDMEDIFQGDVLEQGWEQRGGVSSIRRNAEVWKFALKCVFRALKPRKLKKKGASDEEIKQAQIDAATFIRDGLLTLGPTFVKLGQVISTRTDVLPATYIDVLKTLQDEVPGFSGARAKEIVSKELGHPCDEVFTDFSEKPLKSASLGQVHTAMYKGQKVAIKVQRAGLKELFDVDLKNLKKLAVLLDKFDPKTDGADRDWVSIYEESERLLYLEIDYLNEADNCERFAKDFSNIDYVRVPRVYRDLSTPRVLTMEFVESFKLTDIERIEKLGLDRQKLSKQTADAFLRQIIETSYFHW